MSKWEDFDWENHYEQIFPGYNLRRGYTGKCPACNDGKDRFNINHQHPYLVLCRKCFDNGHWRSIWLFIQERILGNPDPKLAPETIRYVEGLTGWKFNPDHEYTSFNKKKSRYEFVRTLWEGAAPINGTKGVEYFKTRLNVTEWSSPTFKHTYTKSGDRWLPVVLQPMIDNHAVVGVNRIFYKIVKGRILHKNKRFIFFDDKYQPFIIDNCGLLDGTYSNATSIYLIEGSENAEAFMRHKNIAPVIPLLSTSNMKKSVSILLTRFPKLEKVTIIADNDLQKEKPHTQGLQASLSVHDELLSKGLKVRIMMSKNYKDICEAIDARELSKLKLERIV